jgi:hypothetical protein
MCATGSAGGRTAMSPRRGSPAAYPDLPNLRAYLGIDCPTISGRDGPNTNSPTDLASECAPRAESPRCGKQVKVDMRRSLKR